MKILFINTTILSFLFAFHMSFAGLHNSSSTAVHEEPQTALTTQKTYSNKAAGLPTSTSIQAESVGKDIRNQVETFFKQFEMNSPEQLNEQPKKEGKATKNEYDSEYDDLDLDAHSKQFGTTVSEQKEINDQITASLISADDEKFAKSLQLEEYNTNDSSITEMKTVDYGPDASSPQKLSLTNGFENLPIHIGLPPEELYDWKCSCSKMKSLPDGQITLFDDLFEKDCKNHRVVGRDGKPYIRMFHGTPHNSLESFEVNGIKPLGNGDLGEGFYLTTTTEDASNYSLKKILSDEDSPSLSILEILVPLGLSISKFMGCHIAENVNINQHYCKTMANKFVFRAEVLDKLLANKQYIVPDNNDKIDEYASRQWAKTGKSKEEIGRIVQNLQIKK